MHQNLKQARATLGRISKIVVREGVPVLVAGIFYQAVVASILLYGSETWVFLFSNLKVLERFHVETACRLTVMRPKKEKGKWVYPKLAEVLAKASFKTTSQYIAKRRVTVAKTNEDRIILKECRESEKRRGTPVRWMW